MTEIKKEHNQGYEKTPKKTLARWGLVNDFKCTQSIQVNIQ